MKGFPRVCTGKRALSTLAARSWQTTSIPTLYTSSLLDGPEAVASLEAEHLKLKRSASRLFGLQAHYISPSDLNYQLPSRQVAEFAFVGRSNVGKSSLISALVGHQERLVRISKTPGATRTINYFAFANEPPPNHKPEFYLVDLPGYGFAKAAKTDLVKWRATMDGYLKARDLSTLRRVFVLVDSRHGVKKSDEEMMDMLNALALPYQVVLTKTDASSKPELSGALQSTFDELMREGKLACGLPLVHAVSSKSGEGIEQLKVAISEILSHNWSVRDGQAEASSNVETQRLIDSLLEKNPDLIK